MRVNKMKFIGKYIAIGILLGIGISIVDWIYNEMVWNKRVQLSKAAMADLESNVEKIKEKFMVPGYEGLWEALEKSNPRALLNFNLERAKIYDKGVQITGTISNLGPGLWSNLVVEIEALDKNGKIFAECSEILKVMKPGQKEEAIIECPFAKGVDHPDLSEMSFRVIRSILDKTVEQPHNKGS